LKNIKTNLIYFADGRQFLTVVWRSNKFTTRVNILR